MSFLSSPRKDLEVSRNTIATPLVIGLATTIIVCGFSGGIFAQYAEPPPPKGVAVVKAPASLKRNTGPLAVKALSKEARQGLAWLVSHQLNDGGWGQGDESPNMGKSMDGQRAKSNVADTSMAVLALLRSGSTPSRGAHKAATRRGVEFILGQIEASDADSLYVTSVRGTRVQGKIGTYVDTFTALMVLNEAKQHMPSLAANRRLEKARQKVITKIEKNQNANGTWDNKGWAPVLSRSLASKGLNKAAQGGVKVKPQVLARVNEQADKSYDDSSGSFAGGDSAGVELYAGAAASSSIRESAETYRAQEKELKKKAKDGRTKADRDEARKQIAQGQRALKVARKAELSLLERLSDPAFVRGFGNNGGEEFLSYMLVSETLAAENKKSWKKWDKQISQLIAGVQNDDGSWTGHHCITGRTFCTATALLVLMADRAPSGGAKGIHG